MYASLLSFPGGVFHEFDRLRRELDDVFGGAPSSIRSVAPGTFPALNVGSTPAAVEIHAFAPGIDPAKIELTLDRGVLTLTGERDAAPQADGKTRVHSRERTGGRFTRTVALPDDIDPSRIDATYRDGVLRVVVARKEAAQPQRIAIQ